MAEHWVYFELEGQPARARREGDRWACAEVYKLGEGLVPGPLMTVVSEGRVIKRDQFEALVYSYIRRRETDDDPGSC